MNPTESNRPKRKEHILTAVSMAIPRTLQRGYRSLSGDGFSIVATGMSVYCALLSVEAMRVAIPTLTGYSERPKEELRFLPKPYISDGADFSRLSPLPNIERAIAPIAGGSFFGKAPSQKWTVYNEPGLLILSVLLALTINRFQAMVLRRRTPEKIKGQFESANRLKKVRADKDSLAEAKVKAAQYNSYGTGNLLVKTLGVAGSYGLEIAAFVGSFAAPGWNLATVIYGFLQIAGFEIFDRLGKEAEAEDRK